MTQNLPLVTLSALPVPTLPCSQPPTIFIRQRESPCPPAVTPSPSPALSQHESALSLCICLFRKPHLGGDRSTALHGGCQVSHPHQGVRGWGHSCLHILAHTCCPSSLIPAILVGVRTSERSTGGVNIPRAPDVATCRPLLQLHQHAGVSPSASRRGRASPSVHTSVFQARPSLLSLVRLLSATLSFPTATRDDHVPSLPPFFKLGN